MQISPRQDILKNIFSSESFKNLLEIVQSLLQLVYAIMTLTAMVILIVNITKLALSGGVSQRRSEALHGIMVSGICLTILGGIGTVFVLILSFF